MITRIRSILILAGAAVLAQSGYAAPQDITFTTPDGQPVNSASLQGRVTVVMLSGIQDPQCRDEFRALESLAERYQGKPVSIYWVSINTAAEASADKIKRPCGANASIPTLRADLNTFKRLSGRASALPTTVILNKQGQPYGQPRAGFNPNSDFVNDIAAVVDSLLTK